MKKLILVLLFPVLLLPSLAKAQDSGFGLGVILGEPTGLCIKNWVGSNAAIDVAAGWTIGRISKFHLHADYLFHNFKLFDVESGKLPLYFGIGARLKAEPDVRIGVRFPIGICYIFEKAPLDIFLEIAPVLDLLPGTEFKLNGNIGVRYYF